jgi:hypothetical protein
MQAAFEEEKEEVGTKFVLTSIMRFWRGKSTDAKGFVMVKDPLDRGSGYGLGKVSQTDALNFVLAPSQSFELRRSRRQPLICRRRLFTLEGRLPLSSVHRWPPPKPSPSPWAAKEEEGTKSDVFSFVGSRAGEEIRMHLRPYSGKSKPKPKCHSHHFSSEVQKKRKKEEEGGYGKLKPPEDSAVVLDHGFCALATVGHADAAAVQAAHAQRRRRLLTDARLHGQCDLFLCNDTYG